MIQNIQLNKGKISITPVIPPDGNWISPKRIDEVTNDLIFVGWTVDGVNPVNNPPIWRIRKIERIAGIWYFTLANGNYNYVNIWDDRSSLTYS